ncbi:MAG TPA: IPT/TIG domain-containing protein [Solirubrobacteraceae bacterium]|nr:IPT/TIG domain-containing protein [Solirubrobacteraceae bacterium]
MARRARATGVLVGVVLYALGAASAALAAEKAPTITKQPVSVTVEAGQSAKFEAAASASPPATVQWEASSDGGASWSPVAGGTANKLTIASTEVSENGEQLRATFTNTLGHATTNAATLTVHQIPAVTQQPHGVTAEEGQGASFEAAASGSPAPSVQWERSVNGGSTWSPLAEATANRYTIVEVKKAEAGYEYRAVFTNVAGKATSNAATLTVPSHRYMALDWGENTYGQLGDGESERSDVPVLVSGVSHVTAVAGGGHHSLALLSDGTVMAWGAGGDGQLGDGETQSSDVPVAVSGLSGVQAIAAGEHFSLALLSDGTVMAWGSNESGQLGSGNFVDSDVPVAVKGLGGVTAIAAGGEHALALLANGTVDAWGDNELGELGNGKTGRSDVPVAVKGITSATAVAAGGEHSLALLANGTVQAWGGDEYCQLGYRAVKIYEEEEEIIEEPEEEPHSDVPVPVEGLSGVRALAAGSRHSLALLSGGGVMAWGGGAMGQLGDGATPTCQPAAVAVSDLTGVSAIAAGGESSMALLADGAVMSWGQDKSGQLGDGSFGGLSDVPVAVSGLVQVVGIAAGDAHELAFGEPLPEVSAVTPNSGATAGGGEVTITGSGFEGATAVSFGATQAKSFTVNSATSITAVSPAGNLGSVDVTVTGPDGRSTPVPADRFTYVAAPAIKKLSLKKGPGAGASTVTITGSAFTGATKVSFGEGQAEGVKVESATSIVATSPPGAGTVEVTVTTPGGTSTASTKDDFEYIPSVEAISPGSGPVSGGTEVTITGSGFAPGGEATRFKFASKYATEVSCSSYTTCTALTPAGKGSSVAVTAVVGKAKSAAGALARFSYE